MAWLRTLLIGLILLVLTPPYAAIVVICAALRVKDKPGGIYDWIAHTWARAVLFGAGVKIRIKGLERLNESRTAPRIFASNHVSWFDVFVLASIVPRFSFVAKAELLKIPIFGPGALAVGTVPIDRNNRKSAFASYEEAAERIAGGRSVIVFPEGTRGKAYPLRPFKKGPFVLAIASRAPVVPTVVYGTLPIFPRDSYRLHQAGGVVEVEFLEPVPTEGLDYEARDALSRAVHDRMEEALATHGVEPMSALPQVLTPED
ncbi:MAG TPA: lysophospholipid acyltransferase family protein [Gemmatimonadaceae bacterium]|nr:lysophospholipid acyltransferase family protein [Gemmatimonadaceae bacterium]